MNTILWNEQICISCHPLLYCVLWKCSARSVPRIPPHAQLGGVHKVTAGEPESERPLLTGAASGAHSPPPCRYRGEEQPPHHVHLYPQNVALFGNRSLQM